MKAVELEDVEIRVTDLERAAQISKSGSKSGAW
jgi:hypothetical protein